MITRHLTISMDSRPMCMLQVVLGLLVALGRTEAELEPWLLVGSVGVNHVRRGVLIGSADINKSRACA